MRNRRVFGAMERMLLIVLKQFTLSLIVCLLISQVMPAQDSNTNWAILQSIPPGQLTLVKTASGKSLKGQFQRATDSALELSVNGKAVGFQPAEVSRIYVLRGRHILKGALIGAAVGGGAGAGIGAIGGRENNKGFNIIGQGAEVGICAAIGTIAGGLTGLAIGSSKNKKELVYETPRVR